MSNRHLALPTLLLLVATTRGVAADAPVGWASVGDGTTGGAGGEVYTVSTAEEFDRALAADSPKIIRITRTIDLPRPARLTSNTTLEGVGARGRITGSGLHLRRVENVVVRSLAITAADDAIGIEESHHVWVDHCDLSKCRDGLLDIKRGSDFVTVSWNRFHDHRKTCLLGHSDKPGIREIDRGHLRVTYHHNFFDGTATRHPRVRFAEGVHVFNNLYRGNEYGVAAVMDAGVIVEGNVFEDVEQPTLTRYGDSPDPGRLVARDNLTIRSGPIRSRGDVGRASLKYEYQLDPVETVRAQVTAGAGISGHD